MASSRSNRVSTETRKTIFKNFIDNYDLEDSLFTDSDGDPEYKQPAPKRPNNTGDGVIFGWEGEKPSK